MRRSTLAGASVRSRGVLANLDFYAKVPVDLLEGSKQGSVISWIALVVIMTLVYRETQEFLTPKLVSDLSLDKRVMKRTSYSWMGRRLEKQNNGDEDKLEVRFNVTMMDLKCEYATINVVSVLGNQQNVTKDIQRWDLDANGVQQQFALRNPGQHDVFHYDKTVTQSLERLHENGEDAVNLDPETFKFALEDYDFVFVDFFASWCSHCQQLAPTWEKFAEVMHDAEINATAKETDYSLSEYEIAKNLVRPVLIGKMDCVTYDDFCDSLGINAYPTLILYVAGDDNKGGQYRGDRTILSFIHAITEVEKKILTDETQAADLKIHADMAMKKHLNMTRDHEEWLTALERSKNHQRIMWEKDEHPGCMLAGTLHVNRVPGRFFIQADGGAAGHNLDPHMTNLSHSIHHLSFRNKVSDYDISNEIVPDNFDKLTQPFNGNVYVNYELHEAFSHYIKLVSTSAQDYQVIQNSQVSYYPEDRVPEAKFILDISPIAVRYRIVRRPWYAYITSVLAIVGGTFTVVGMLQAVLLAGTKQLTKPRKPMNLPLPPGGKRSAP